MSNKGSIIYCGDNLRYFLRFYAFVNDLTMYQAAEAFKIKRATYNNIQLGKQVKLRASTRGDIIRWLFEETSEESANSVVRRKLNYTKRPYKRRNEDAEPGEG